MKVLVAQGGGPTAVINHSLVGLVLAARRFSKIEDVYGSRHGVAGILSEDFIDLGQESVGVSRSPLSSKTMPVSRLGCLVQAPVARATRFSASTACTASHSGLSTIAECSPG